MKHTTWMLAALTLLLVGLGQAKAGFIITFAQSGSDVVATGDGSLNLTALTLQDSAVNVQAVIGPSLIENGTPGSNVYYFTGITGPADFGPASLEYADTGMGMMAGTGMNGIWLVIDQAYSSGTPFSDSAT